MRRITKKQLCTSLLSIFLLGHYEMADAANATWVGGTSTDWNTNANWSPAAQPTNQAQFTGTAATFFPNISTVESLDGIQFLNIPKTYAIDIDSGDLKIGSAAVDPAQGVDNSILGANALNQAINLRNSSALTFNNASADINSSGKVTYNINQAGVGLFSQLDFNEASTAGAATFNLSATAGGLSQLDFNDTSTASTAKFNLSGTGGGFSLVRFFDNATAANSIINGSSNTSIVFSDSSTPGASTMNSSGGLLFFNTNNPTSTATVNLSNGATFQSVQSIEVGDLNSLSVSDEIQIQSVYVATNTTTNGNVINGQITGTGDFRVLGTGTVEFTNNANDYAGRTFVDEASTLITSTRSLPAGPALYGIYINPGATLHLKDTVDNTFSGDILNEGTILYTGTADLTLTGTLLPNVFPGSDQVIVDAPLGSLTLAAVGFDFISNLHLLAGTFNSSIGSLYNVDVQPGANLELVAGISNAGSIVNNGTVHTLGAGFVNIDTTEYSGSGNTIVESPNGGLAFFGVTPMSYIGDFDVVQGTLSGTPQGFQVEGEKNIYANGIFRFVTNGVSGTFAGDINNNGKVLTEAFNSNIFLTGDISGSGQLEVNNTSPAVTVLRGINTYQGGTYVNSGILQTYSQSLPTGGQRTVDPSCQLIFDNVNFDDYVGSIVNNGELNFSPDCDMIMSGVISGTGDVSINGSQGSTVTYNAVNTYSGFTNINNGTLATPTQFLPPGAAVTTVGIAQGATLRFTNTIYGIYEDGIANFGRIVYSGTSDAGISGNISGTGFLEVDSPGQRFTLSGTNTYTGATDVSNGTLQVTTASLPAASAVNVDPNGVLDFRNTSAATYNGTIVDNGTVINTSTANLTFNGSIIGLGQFIVDSPGTTTTLAGGNTYTGGTIVEKGTLVTNSLSLPALATFPSVEVNNYGVLQFSQSSAGTYTGSILLNTPTSSLVTTGSALTLSGPIQGEGALVVSSNLTLTNPDNNYSGGTTINPLASLTGDSFSLQGNILDNGTLVFNQNTDGVFYGAISSSSPGVGVINKNGAGTLTFNTDSPNFQGQTNILDGTFDLNAILGGNLTIDSAALTGSSTIKGNLSLLNGSTGTGNTYVKNNVIIDNSSSFKGSLNADGNVLVNNGSLLSGDSTIAGNLSITNGSTISPGGDNNIGVVNVGGNYLQDSTSTYFCDIGGCVGCNSGQCGECDFRLCDNCNLGCNGESDRINVEGDASLAGTIHYNILDATVNPCCIYQVMHVEGDITGRFDNVTTNKGIFVPLVDYRDNDGSNDVLVSFQNIFNFIAKDCNQFAIADQFACINDPSSEVKEIIDELIALGNNPNTIDEARHAYDQMTGMQYLAMTAANELAGHRFVRQLYDPIRSIVTNTEPHRVYYDDPCCQSVCCETHHCFSGWIQGGGGHTTISGNSCARGAKVKTYDITGGFQGRFGDDWTVGLAGSYVNDRINYNIGGSGTTRSGFIGAYGLYRPCSWYFLGDLAYGFTRNSVKRSVDLGDLHFHGKSNPKVQQVLAYIEAGFDVPVSKILIQPFLGFEAGFLNRDKFTETGSYPLNLVVSEKERSNLYSRLGVHLTTNGMCRSFALSVDLAWQCRLNNVGSRIHERFQSFGDRFSIRGMDFSRNSFDGAATFTAFLKDNWEFYVELSGEKWSRASSYDVIGGIKFSW